ncbi:hypothetical protein HI914_06749 [Erysiphe necator]|nr:hypothetical protein HI914_06749 [Erysiphe necator]
MPSAIFYPPIYSQPFNQRFPQQFTQPFPQLSQQPFSQPFHSLSNDNNFKLQDLRIYVLFLKVPQK